MKRSTSEWHRPAAALALLLAAASPALAYEHSRCGSGGRLAWGSNTITFRPANISFPGAYRTALEAVLAGWNFNTPGTRFRFNHVYTDATTFAEGDGINSVGFVDDWRWGDFLAIALWRWNSCSIFSGTLSEVDILFNNDYPFDTAVSPAALPRPGDVFFNLAVTGLHEYGHGFGLNHEEDVLATMNSIYPFGGVLGNRYDLHPHADDILGDRAIYGTCCTERDLAASAYRRTSAGRSDLIATPATSYRGHSVPFLFTISNRGTTNETSARVQFYLSPDRSISTADTFLGAATYSLNAGIESTFTAFVTIPTGLAPGSYHFGYVMDPLGAVTEIDEGNNAVGHSAPTNVPSFSPPISCFTASPTAGRSPLRVTFNAGCSRDPDGSIASYHWRFGDGGTGTGPNPVHTYGSGSFQVILTVTDNSGNTAQTTGWIEATCAGCPV